ncbi:unnamed protein product [Parascedosporium putredinis]|uniref:SAM-dependent methyltransferase n=1 Tax=Parascedosporium putredinis TaxID=1442378 RepID=A0A9P1MC88_9PEZI|nr:unnamed protein product [Parascedosporium putredinis]CAI7996123.1 unnamed protein product [Parascedosporium putredinis]
MEQHDSFQLAKYSALTWNAPLSEHHASSLLKHLDLANATRIVDLGCGWGELLLRAAFEAGPSSQAIGVDTDPVVLARENATPKTAGWGASSDTRAMLEHLATVVPKGKVLIGDTCWERSPTEAAVAIFGEEIPRLSDVVVFSRQAGWKVMHVSTADTREWDDFESGHRAGPRGWLLENQGDPRAPDIEAEQNRREDEYQTVYRGVLSFAYLVLAR